MKDIHSLIHSLNRSEQRITRAALTAFSSRKDSSTKSLELFDFIAKNKEYIPTNSECAAHIYNDPKDKRFTMLKLRFRQKLLDSVSLDMNLYKKEMFDATELGSVKVRKKIAQLFHLYFSKGEQTILNNLLDEIINISKKYECYAPLVDALRFKKFSKGYLKGENDYNRVNNEIDFYESCNKAVHKANDHYYRLLIKGNFNARTDTAKMQLYLEESILELKSDYKSTKSPLVGYYLKILEMAYYENDENYLLALETCTELLSIVKNNKSVYRKSRLANVYLNSCQYAIFLKQYKEAVINAKLAQEVVLLVSHYMLSQECEFNALFHEHQLLEAESLILILIDKAIKIQGDDFRLAKYRFYYAAVLFKKGDYKAVLKELNNTLEISKDKEGYGTAIRVLTIMALIELDRLDEVSSRLDSLRKHLERNLEKENTRRREKTIFNVLQLFEKSGFDFKIAEDKKVMAALQLLESDDKVYKWQPLSSELIPFHQWFIEKYGKKKSRSRGGLESEIA